MGPVTARLLALPYRWSSFGANALGRRDTLITPHAAFLALGGDESSRRLAYVELFRSELEPGELDDIRLSANAGYALCSERFRKEIESAVGRRAGPGKPGRPSKDPLEDTDSQSVLF